MRKQVEEIAYTLALCVFVWLSEIWMSPPEHALPVISKIAFVIATSLQGFLLQAMAGQSGTNAARDRLLRSLAFAAPFYLFMVILMNVPLPSIGALVLLITSALAGFLARREAKDTADPSLAPTHWPQWLVIAPALAMIVLSAAPVLQHTQDVLFALILAMAVTGVIARPFAARHWSEHIAYALSAIALMVGILTA